MLKDLLFVTLGGSFHNEAMEGINRSFWDPLVAKLAVHRWLESPSIIKPEWHTQLPSPLGLEVVPFTVEFHR
jgi:hypothetical protein